MIKYWSTLITVSGISLSAKLSSLQGNKRRAKLVTAKKVKYLFIYLFFFSVLDATENKELISNQGIFSTFQGCGGASAGWPVWVPKSSYKVTQKILTHNDESLWKCPLFVFPNLNPKQVKTALSPKPLGSYRDCFPCFPFERLSPFVFSRRIFVTKIFPEGFDLCTFLLAFSLFPCFSGMLICTHRISGLEDKNKKQVETFCLCGHKITHFRLLCFSSTWASFTSLKGREIHVSWHFPQGTEWKLDRKSLDSLDLLPSCFCHVSCFF